MNNEINELKTQVSSLYKEYKNDKEIIHKLKILLYTNIPQQLKSIKSTNELKKNKAKEQKKIDDDFVEKYLLNCNYSYCNRSEIFIHYINNHFTFISEDKIQHEILTTISNFPTHINKYKINKRIIKELKTIYPLTIKPEKETIHEVIHYFDKCWDNINIIKYFLCVIGDFILKKITNQNIYIVPRNLKNILRCIDTEFYSNFGTANILHNIKLKFYDHNYTSCRLLYMSSIHKSPSIDAHKNYIDIMNVACYYSNKYENSDIFLQKHCKDTNVKNHILYLTDKTEDSVIDRFINKSITNCNNSSISSKDVLFIWKKHIENENIPNIMFNETILQVMKKKIDYSEENDKFNNITSIYLPFISDFTQFWENNIEECGDSDLLIDDFILLMNKIKDIKIDSNHQFIIDLIHYYYPDIVIENNIIKYIKPF